MTRSGDRSGEMLLKGQAQWVTPATRDYKGANSELHVTETGGGRRHMDQLSNQVQYVWPTPNSTPSAPNASTTRENGRIANRINEQCLETLACSLPGPPTEGSGQPSSESAPNSPRRLNPKFVEWLQGLPEGWTSPEPINSEVLATWLSQCRERLRFLCS